MPGFDCDSLVQNKRPFEENPKLTCNQSQSTGSDLVVVQFWLMFGHRSHKVNSSVISGSFEATEKEDQAKWLSVVQKCFSPVRFPLKQPRGTSKNAPFVRLPFLGWYPFAFPLKRLTEPRRGFNCSIPWPRVAQRFIPSKRRTPKFEPTLG